MEDWQRDLLRRTTGWCESGSGSMEGREGDQNRYNSWPALETCCLSPGNGRC